MIASDSRLLQQAAVCFKKHSSVVRCRVWSLMIGRQKLFQINSELLSKIESVHIITLPSTCRWLSPLIHVPVLCCANKKIDATGGRRWVRRLKSPDQGGKQNLAQLIGSSVGQGFACLLDQDFALLT